MLVPFDRQLPILAWSPMWTKRVFVWDQPCSFRSPWYNRSILLKPSTTTFVKAIIALLRFENKNVIFATVPPSVSTGAKFPLSRRSRRPCLHAPTRYDTQQPTFCMVFKPDNGKIFTGSTSRPSSGQFFDRNADAAICLRYPTLFSFTSLYCRSFCFYSCIDERLRRLKYHLLTHSLTYFKTKWIINDYGASLRLTLVSPPSECIDSVAAMVTT